MQLLINNIKYNCIPVPEHAKEAQESKVNGCVEASYYYWDNLPPSDVAKGIIYITDEEGHLYLNSKPRFVNRFGYLAVEEPVTDDFVVCFDEDEVVI
jgi:hypothetical protein